MTPQTMTQSVQTQLEQTLTETALPKSARQVGRRLLLRLKAPIRIVVMGLPQSGKSRVINMLIGREVLPDGLDVGQVELRPGQITRTMLTDGSTGQTVTRDGVALSGLPQGRIANAVVELPDLPMGNVSLSEVRLSGSYGAQQHAVDKAASKADIILWCTQEFDQTEEALWSRVPDQNKDRSFLVLTKADKLSMKGILQKRIENLQDVVAEEFLGLFPLATLQAIAARQPDGDDKKRWAASGGKALQQELGRQIKSGLSADRDRALFFITKYASYVSQNQPPRVTRADDPPAAAPAPPPPTPETQPAPQARTDLAPAAPAAAAVIEDPLPGLDHGFLPGLDDKPLPGLEPTSRGSDKSQAMADAIELLRTRAVSLSRALQESAPDNSAVVLDQCMAVVNELTELFGTEPGEDGVTASLQFDVQESADMMVLFQMEKTDQAAADGVTLLLQLQKEMIGAR